MARQATCHTCVYAHRDRCLWMRSLGSGWPAGPTCGNQPDSYGRMKECPCGTVCRNYRARPPVPQGDGVKTIPLGEGLYAYVDAADYEWLSQWRWRARGGYAARCEKHDGKSKVIFMHREIMKPPKGKIVDHINGNKLDDTRANLRNITQQQNVHNNGKPFGTTSIYKGVYYNKRNHRWQVTISFAGKSIYLGLFDTEEAAARAYDRGAAEMFGEFARLNFPEEWPPERRREVHADWRREQARQKGKAGGRRGNARVRTRAPAREGRKKTTRKATRVARRASRKAPSRVRR